MSELIYLISVFLFFAVAKLITTYGHTKETSGYTRTVTTSPFPRLSEMALPRLFLIIILGFIPFLNTILTLVGFIYAAINGFGPTGSDVSDWFKARFKKKATTE